jgi:hypothetical protein
VRLVHDETVDSGLSFDHHFGFTKLSHYLFDCNLLIRLLANNHLFFNKNLLEKAISKLLLNLHYKVKGLVSEVVHINSTRTVRCEQVVLSCLYIYDFVNTQIYDFTIRFHL